MTASDEPNTAADILNIALKKEKAAYKFYDTQMQKTKVPFVRDLLEKLREEETHHIQYIETAIAHLHTGHDL